MQNQLQILTTLFLISAAFATVFFAGLNGLDMIFMVGLASVLGGAQLVRGEVERR